MSEPRHRKTYHGTALSPEAHAALRAEAFATGETMQDLASRIILAWFEERARDEGVRRRAAQRIERAGISMAQREDEADDYDRRCKL